MEKKPFSSLWYVLFCLHQHSFPKILFHSLAPLQAKSQNHRIVKVVSVSLCPKWLECLDSISVWAHPVQWQKMEHFTEDPSSLWSISECSPSWPGPRNPIPALSILKPHPLSHHVQSPLWTKMLFEAPNSSPRTVCSSGKHFCAFDSAGSQWQNVSGLKTFDQCLCNIALSLHSPVLCSLWQFILQSVIQLKTSVLTIGGTSDLCPGYLIDQLKATDENQCQQFSSLLEQSILHYIKAAWSRMSHFWSKTMTWSPVSSEALWASWHFVLRGECIPSI